MVKEAIVRPGFGGRWPHYARKELGGQRLFLKVWMRVIMRRKAEAYFCEVIGEQVHISLKNKKGFGPKYTRDYFVQCDQEECQYVDENISPCPLFIEMFGNPPPN